MHVKVTATWMTSSKISSIISHFNGIINVTPLASDLKVLADC